MQNVLLKKQQPQKYNELIKQERENSESQDTHIVISPSCHDGKELAFWSTELSSPM